MKRIIYLKIRETGSWLEYLFSRSLVLTSALVMLAIQSNAALNGTYTVNSTLPASSTNYQNIASVISDLSAGTRTDGGTPNGAGVSGPVFINIASGTYTGQVVFPSTITGLSNTNRLTISGAGTSTIIRDSLNAPIIIINQLRYVTIRNLAVTNNYSGVSTGIAIIGSNSTNAGTGCTISNCTVSLPNTGTSTSYGIILTGTATGLSDGNQRADSVTIDSNTTFGAYYAIQVSTSANGNASYNRGHKIRWNTINNAYYYGIRCYYIYNAVDIIGNTINMNPSNVSSYGIYFYYNQNTLAATKSSIIGNTVYAGYAALYFYYFRSPAGDAIKMYNNILITYGTSAYAGAYVYTGATGGGQVECYHNTVTALGGSASYAFYYYNVATGTSYIKNNIFTANGSATYPAYYSTNPAGNVINYNNYFNSVGANLVYRGSAYNASNYKTATAGGDSSFNVRPGFISATNEHLKTICEPVGVDLTASVSVDIDGNVRSTAPIIGADEVTALTNNLMLEAILAPVPPIVAGTQDVAVRFKNVGSNVVTSFNVSYIHNGGTPVTVNWSGTLNPCDTVSVYFTGANQITLLPANTIKVYGHSPNGFADTDASNDTINLNYLLPLSGTYTVGGAGANFATVADAANALSAGVVGPVTFVVNPGTYTGKVTVPSGIAGAGYSNPIVFSGVDKATTIISNNSTSMAVVEINQAKYVTFRNLTINNTSTSGGTGVAIIGNASSNVGVGCAVINCNINLSAPDNGTTSYGIMVTGSLTGFALSNNYVDSVTIDSNTISGGNTYGISIYGNTTSPSSSYNRGHMVRYNTVNNSYNYGIYIYYNYNAMDVINNTVNMSLNTPASTLSYGIYYYYNQNSSTTTSTRLIGNVVKNMTYIGLYYYYAIGTAAAPVKIYNNAVIGGFRYTSTNYGLYAYNSTAGYYEIYHNSVNMDNNASTIYGLYSYGNASGVVIKNNILNISATSSATPYPLYLSTNPSGNVVNYNQYYNAANANALYRGAAISSAAYRTATAGGDSSWYAIPAWNTTDLHLTSACGNSGVNLNAFVPVDIDGDVRSNTPRVGYDEFNGYNNDIMIERLVTPSIPVTAGTQDLIVRVKNMGANAITSFSISYRHNGAAPQTQYFSGTLNSCDTVSITFTGAQQINLLGSNDILLYTADPNGTPDTNRNNDTLRNSFLVPLNGNYTIGGSTANFNTFTDAVSALQNGGISGPVYFTVNPGTYTTPVDIVGPIVGTSATNTIVFDGVNANTRTIVTSNNGPSFRAKEVSYLTIKNLTVTNTFSGVCTGIAMIGSTASNAGVGFTVKNCKINLPNTGTSTSYGIIVTGALGGISDANQWTDSVTIDSNYIKGGYYGIQISTSANGNANYNRGHKIRYNTLDSTYYYGIRFYYVYNAVDIIGNTINMNPVNNSSYGMYVYYNQNSSTAAATRIIGNKVYAGYAGLYFYYFTSPLNNPISIFNNAFATYGPSAYVGTYVYTGATGGGEVNYYHNSLNMLGASASYALYYYNSSSGTSNIKNNIFLVNGSTSYPAYFSTSPAGNVVNYNVYYNSVGSNLVYRNSTAYNSSTYRTATAGGDTSYNQVPSFVASNDLHMTNACLRGVDLTAVVPTDFDGNTRSITPVIGAHEAAGLNYDVALLSATITTPIVAGAQDISVLIRNNSSNTLTSLNVNHSVNGGTVNTYNWSGTINGCDTATITLTGAAQITLVNGTNLVRVYTSSPNGNTDQNMANDSVRMFFSPVSALPGNALICNGTPGSPAGSNVIFANRASMTGTTAFTAEAWVKVTNPTTDQKIMSKSSTGNGFVLGVNPTGKFDPELWTVATGTTSQRITSNGVSLANNVVPANTWTHLALTWQSGVGIRAYINGVLVGYLNSTTVTTMSPSSNDLTIGVSSWDNASFPLTGAIDEVRLWNVALDSATIRANMHKTLKGTEAGLTTYIQFNEAANSVYCADAVGGSTGIKNNAAVLASSTAPFGGDTCLTNLGVTSGTFALNSLNVITVDAFDNAVDLLMNEVPVSPNILPTAPVTLNNRYWIINPIGNPGVYDVSLVFNLPTNFISASDTAMRLYRRSAYSDGAWTLVQTAIPANLSAGSVTFTGISTLGMFTLASNGNSPLPVKLLTFGGKQVNNDVLLSWTTENERNNSGFILERSVDGVTYAQVGFVKGTNQTGVSKYNWLDNKVDLSRTIYYRLKQVDFDGKFTYSPIVTIEPVITSSALVYPNPVADELYIALPEVNGGKVAIEIMDLQGRILLSKSSNADKVIRVEETTALAPGVYIARIKANGVTSEHKFIKAHN